MNYHKLKRAFLFFPAETHKFFLISFLFAFVLCLIEIIFFYLLSQLLQNTFNSQGNVTFKIFEFGNLDFKLLLFAFVGSVFILQFGNILYLYLNSKICAKIISVTTKKYLFSKKVFLSFYNFKSKANQFQKVLTQDIDIVLSSILNPIFRLTPNLMKTCIALFIIFQTSERAVLIVCILLCVMCFLLNYFFKGILEKQKKWITSLLKERQTVIHDFSEGVLELKVMGYDTNIKNKITKLQYYIADRLGGINLLISSPKYLLELLLFCIFAFFLYTIHLSGDDKNKNLANIGVWLVALQRLLSGIEGANQCIRNIKTFSGFLKPFKQ